MSVSDGQLSVLHVDDDPALGSLVAAYLERDGSGLRCRVRTETDPEAALAAIRDPETAFDCVISDYNMPGMNGIEFLEAVREDHPTLPLLLFSGEETNDVAAEIIRAGLTDYLKKGGADRYTMLIRRVEHAVDSTGQFDHEAEAAVEAVGVVGVDGRFQTADEAYASVYGYEPEEVEGKHWAELHPEDEVEHIRTHVLPVVRDGGEWNGRSRGFRADGSTFTESKRVTALDDGRLLIAVSELDDAAVASEP